AGLSHRPVKIHREARRHDQISSDRFDAQVVELSRQHDGVLVMQRRITARDHEIALQGSRGSIDLANCPNGSYEAMIETEALQGRECSRQLYRRRRIEFFID